MTDLFGRLAARTLGKIPIAKPLVPSRYPGVVDPPWQKTDVSPESEYPAASTPDQQDLGSSQTIVNKTEKVIQIQSPMPFQPSQLVQGEQLTSTPPINATHVKRQEVPVFSDQQSTPSQELLGEIQEAKTNGNSNKVAVRKDVPQHVQPNSEAPSPQQHPDPPGADESAIENPISMDEPGPIRPTLVPLPPNKPDQKFNVENNLTDTTSPTIDRKQNPQAPASVR
ncbi:MAG: hypothetical protein ACYTKC_12110, partial [Planctomycetota bacterium]